MWDGIIVTLPAAIFCLFIGNWSDYHGRKPLLILPFIGNILSYTFYILNYYFFYELSSGYLLLGSVAGAFGGYQAFNMGLYGYVSDVSTVVDRTMRLSILNGVFSLGYVLGTMTDAALYDRIGDYYVIFGISIGFAVIGLIWSILIRESVKTDASEKKAHKFFDLDNVKQSMQTAFKKRPDNGRVNIILLVINFAIFMFCLNTYSYDYLLVQKKYNWTIVEYSRYLSIQRVCRLTGLFVFLPLLSRVFKVNDSLVASICTLATIGSYFLMAVGQESWRGPNDNWAVGWVMYLSAVLQFNSVITVIIR